MAVAAPPIAVGTSVVGRAYLEKLISEMAPNENDALLAKEAFLDRFFGALDNVEKWEAVKANPWSLLEANARIGVWRQELRQAVDYYITALPWLQHPHIDWTLANVLIYAEVAATLYQWTPAYRSDGAINWGLWALSLGGDLLKWGITMAVIVAAVIFDLPWVALMLGGLTVWRQVVIGIANCRKAKILAAQMNSYDAAKTSTLSWSALWQQLGETRTLGGYWDPELYRLVELRMKST